MSEKRNNEIFTSGQSHTVNDFNYTVPTEIAPLPSKGKVYSKAHPLHGLEAVEIRSMTAREEDILTSRAYMKKGTTIDELIKSCLAVPGVNVDSILAGDRNALMITIRITGYGQDYNAEVQCSSCKETAEMTFDLSKLSLKGLDIEPVQPGQNAFTFKLPKSGKTVVFKFLTSGEERDMVTEIERRKKIASNANDNIVTTKLQRSIISIDGVDDAGKLASFIRNMPALDSRALRTFIDKHEPGIDMKAKCVCPLCDAEQEVEMPIGAKFFWPDAK